MKFIITMVIFALLFTGIFIWSGIYNVAANNKHYAFTSGLLELVREQSVNSRLSDIVVPALNDKQQIKQGAQFYAQMCAACHLAPGISESELHAGLYPQPPLLSQNENKHNKHSAAKQFWIIKNGLKMTGMPAWSPAHNDEQIWSMVAFIKQLKNMSVDEYNLLISFSNNSHDAGAHSH